MPGSKDKILIVDDQPSVRFGLRNLLEAENYRVYEAETGAQALGRTTANAPQLILLDLRLPDTNGISLLPHLKAIDDEVPVIILTAHGTIETAIKALKNGAENFLTKPFDSDSLLILIHKTLEQSRARRERWLFGLEQQQVAAEYFVGQSDAIKRIHATVKRLAVSETTVLLQGETGTGKGMVANLIHRLSERREQPFVAINCAGLSKELLEAAEGQEEFLSLEEVEQLHIQRVWQATEGNLSRTAEPLGITRTTLYNKLRKYQLDAPKSD